MILLLKLLFSTIFLCMVGVTTAASLERDVFTAGGALWPEAWFRATLADAYFGFLTFYIWVAYKERRALGRVLWFALIMLLGNLAMSAYVLRELFRLRPGESLETLLLKRRV